MLDKVTLGRSTTNFLKKAAVSAVLIVTSITLPSYAAVSDTPEETLKSFLRAMYARDVDAAYAMLAKADQSEKTLEDYRAENGSFAGPTLDLSRGLADEIRFLKVEADVDGDTAEMVLSAELPDANAEALDDVVSAFDRKVLRGLSSADISGRLKSIRALSDAGSMPMMLTENEQWDLVKEDGEWRVLLNWAEAVEVRFEAFVVGDLGWEFEPVRKRVLARHGETIEMSYRARNVGENTTIGKARHIIGPRRHADFMEIIACFCFLEQTLAPGEETTLPLVFRVDFEAPDAATDFTVRYDFFPMDRFPELDG